MATLPPGWEWDYDGNRWLYRYTPTGHVQYHFPSAGDEFPDFIDAASPAPDLAPEEKLESQQQVKRHTSVTGGPSRTGRAAAGDEDGWKWRMSATAQPVSAVWEDDFGAEDDKDNDDEVEGEAVFQPENFMYLGPGTYVDVSPLVEEEEEAARRAVVGAEQRAGLPTDSNRGVSPMVSQNTTPMVRTSEAIARTETGARDHGFTTAANERALEPPPPIISYEEPAMVTPIDGYIVGDDVVGEASAVPDEEEALNYDMYELPVETAVPLHLQFDPVGVVAEMPTEHTASARVETHPDPVELAGTYIMAPVEIEPRPGFVELPAEIDLGEDGELREERLTDQQRLELRRQEVRQHQEERQRGVQQRKEERKKREAEELQRELEMQQSKEGYSPSQEQSNGITQSFKIARKPTLRESSAVYNAYAGRNQAQAQAQEDYQAYAPGQAPQTSATLPARRMSPALQREASLNMSMRPATAASKPPVDSGPGVGVVKYPSVLRPARGKPGQSPERQDVKASEQGSVASSSVDARVSGYHLIRHGQHPPSMTPAPAPIPAPAAAVPLNPPQQPPIATAQPPAPIQRPYTTAQDLPQSNIQMAQQYAVPPIPPKVPAQQLPYPTGSVRMPQPPLIRHSTTPYPHDDGPPAITPYGPLQNQQPLRPASAMPVLQHQRRGGPAPGQPQQMPIRTGPVPPGAVIVPAGTAPRSATAGPAQQRRQSFQPGQNAVPLQSQQPQRPQSVVNPGVYANFASYQTPPPQPRPIQRRPTQEDVSPIRSRSQSMSSGAAPLDTPSPIDSRRSSTNSIASPNVNNSYFASISGSQGSPSNVSLARPQDSPQSPVTRGGRQSAPPQQLANVNQGNTQGMPPPQPQPQMQQPNSATVSDAEPQSPTRIGPTASGHLLTSIEEHDEAQHVAAVAPLKVNQRRVLTKAPPNSTTPASPLNQRGPQQIPLPGSLQTQAQIPQQMGPPGQVPGLGMPRQGFQPVGIPMQQPLQQQWAAQPGPLPPLQTAQQTSPTAGNKENRKSWGKWFKSSGSKSAAQSPVAQQPQHAFPPVPIPQAMPGPNQPFQMQSGGQQFPAGFQGGQPVNQQFTPAPLNVGTNSMAGGEQFPNGMTPAPLFSGASSSKRPVASPTETGQQAAGPGSQNRWAGKSPVDYSGGGWGDDDDEFS
ncbi:hypothetical protein MKX08_001977 [Trichoderma sp. CBMAI-0020]|nr:hypothetical protein MKX08_001977 [Trichoderma sp. CBMAI-0020]